MKKLHVYCPYCGNEADLTLSEWRCKCGEAWEPVVQCSFDKNKIQPQNNGLWRYGEIFGLGFSEEKITLGAGWTPLLKAAYKNHEIYLKLDYLSPTGSFKDRGTEVEINVLYEMGAKIVVDDSSGNAGSSLAAYAARAGIGAEIFVPDYASKNKKDQIAIYGARVNSIPGLRENAKKEAIESIHQDGVVYASHAYNPYFLLGQQSVAWEIWEQLGSQSPDWYVMPVGQGVHLLGAWMGFSRLKDAGLINKVPRMVAVQPTLLNPIVSAINQSVDELPEIKVIKPSIAEGLAIAKPVRWKRILEAIRKSNGIGISVEENEIINAQQELGRMGFYVEPTSATVIAALDKLWKIVKPNDIVVVGMTGTGLKGTPKFD